MPLTLLSRLFDFIVPPRESEKLVGGLSLDDVRGLQTAQGLPYAERAVTALVWELKYHANKRAAALAGALLAEELLAIAAEELGKPFLIPVPMHQKRRRERGHNQTELLCEAALRCLGSASEDFFTGKSSAPLEYTPRTLARITLTPEQQKLDRAKRLKNVAGSMQADSALVKGRVCVVVDDVTTTGATLSEAARALKQAGALRVHTLALAYS